MLNVEALFDFELTVRCSIINNFEARYTTIILTIFGRTKMFEKVKNLYLGKDAHLQLCRNAHWFHQHSEHS